MGGTKDGRGEMMGITTHRNVHYGHLFFLAFLLSIYVASSSEHDLGVSRRRWLVIWIFTLVQIKSNTFNLFMLARPLVS